VASVCAGDESAFEEIFERHKKQIGAIAGRFFQDHAEDIVQECFVRAYFALPDFTDQGVGSLRAWLSKIAFNTCYDELRRREKRRESRLSDLTEDETRVMKALAFASEQASIESVAVSRDLANKLLARVSPEDRLVLILMDAEGVSVSEIGQIMGWSVPKVKIRLFRARAHLRRILQNFL
jgi:RNA polymerase sigma-70 factor (ECF subfamily)